MPEGHTIHRLAADIHRQLAGAPVDATSPQGRFAEGARLVDGTVLERAVAFGKHLFLKWESGAVIHVHLGLIGKFRHRSADLPPATENIRLRLERGEHAWELAGPSTCAVITPEEMREVTSRLGPDPLRRAARFELFAERLGRKKIAIGAALLDQSVVAGIGNVYRAELLFLHRIHPETLATELQPEEVRSLWDEIVGQLRSGKRLDRIVTVEPAVVGYRSAAKIPDGDRLYVYKRDGLPCRICGTEIRLIEVAQRKTWFCPTCQPPPPPRAT